jgi:L-2-hydroxyglutarate oxidase LhgO
MGDICIIGAGVVGCAIARELAQRGFSVTLVEKHEAAGQETSALNSRVIHSGFHEQPGTLKSTLALEGSRRIIQYAENRGIAFSRTGMLIAVPHGSIRDGLWREAGALWNLWRNGKRQNIPFRFIPTAAGVRQIARIHALAGIFIPSVCVICVEDFVAALIEDAKAAGAKFIFDSPVISISPEKTHYIIETPRRRINAQILVNSAGLHAHEISVMAGGPAYEVEFIRGDYYEVLGGIARWGIRTLVYPAMPSRSLSKGIHVGPRTDGRLFMGPSATPASQEAPKELFLHAARRFLPDIQEHDLKWAYAGVRPKLSTKDFVIRCDRTEPPLINLIGIDSPGLSASMAIARYVAETIQKCRGGL